MDHIGRCIEPKQGLEEIACRLVHEFAELTLVLPANYLLALETAALLEGMTTGHLVRCLIHKELARKDIVPPGSARPRRDCADGCAANSPGQAGEEPAGMNNSIRDERIEAMPHLPSERA